MAETPDLPPWLIAVAGRFITIRSLGDRQDGLAAFCTKKAGERVARSVAGAVVVETTEEMFVEACISAYKMGVPYLYIGSELAIGVDFRRVPLDMTFGPLRNALGDGQHRFNPKATPTDGAGGS